MMQDTDLYARCKKHSLDILAIFFQVPLFLFLFQRRQSSSFRYFLNILDLKSGNLSSPCLQNISIKSINPFIHTEKEFNASKLPFA